MCLQPDSHGLDKDTRVKGALALVLRYNAHAHGPPETDYSQMRPRAFIAFIEPIELSYLECSIRRL